MLYKLKTFDRFYFRGNGENSAGEFHRPSSIFPPSLQTLYGAIRSNWIVQHGNLEDFRQGKYADSIGTITETGSFKLSSIFLALNGILYLPLPLDTQVTYKEGNYYAKPLKITKGLGNESDQSIYRFVAQEKGKSKDNSDFWIAIQDLKDLFANKETACLPLSDFVVPEDKVGIAINLETNVVTEGMMYQITGYYLNEGVELVINMEIPNDLSYLKIGNKGTMWSIEKAKEYNAQLKILNQLPLDETATYLRVTTLSPSIITGELFNQNGTYKWNPMSKFIQAIVPRKVVLAGWDMEENKPKAKLPTLQAGTTFIVERDPVEPLNKQMKQISGFLHTDLQEEAGYGQVLVTTVNPQLELK